MLLQHNGKVYIAARDQVKGEAAIQELKSTIGKEAVFLKLDLGNLKAVKKAAEEFLRFNLSAHEGVLHGNFATARRLGWMSSSTMRQYNQPFTDTPPYLCEDF